MPETDDLDNLIWQRICQGNRDHPWPIIHSHMRSYLLRLIVGCLLSSLLQLQGALPGAATASATGDIDVTIAVVNAAEQLVSALDSGVSHVRLTAHVDLRSYEVLDPDADAVFAAGAQLISLTVREPVTSNLKNPPSRSSHPQLSFESLFGRRAAQGYTSHFASVRFDRVTLRMQCAS